MVVKTVYPVTIKEKYRISPYLGLGIMYNHQSSDYGSISSTDVPVYAGISWFVGPGSLDLGFQFGKNFMTTIGYTFSPSTLIKKKKQ